MLCHAGYVFVGHSQPEVTFRANAIKTTAKGARMLHFADGTSIDIAYPAYYMRGGSGLKLHWTLGSHLMCQRIGAANHPLPHIHSCIRR